MPGRTGRCGPRGVFVAAAAIAAAVVPLGAAWGATPGASPDPVSYVTDGPVHAIERAAGRTYIGGQFEHVGQRSGHGVALSAGDASVVGPQPGSGDFPEVAGGAIHAVASDTKGGWFIAGDFTSVGGQPRDGLAHVLQGGAVDSWSPAVDGTVHALAVGTSSPALYVGGDFTSIAGEARAHLAGFTMTGSPPALNDWKPTSDPDAPVRALTTVEIPGIEMNAPPGGTKAMTMVIAGGEFQNLVASSADRFAAIWGFGATDKAGATLAGTVVSSTQSFGGTVRTLAVGPAIQDASNVYVPVYAGGEFTSPEQKLAAVQLKVTNKGPDPLGPTASNSPYSGWEPVPSNIGDVHAVALAPRDGNQQTVYLGGTFDGTIGGAAGATRRFLAAVDGIPLDPSTVGGSGCTSSCLETLKATWNPNPDQPVKSLAATGGSVFVGGEFASIGSAPRNGLAAVGVASIGGDGDASPSWNPRPAGGPTHALALAPDGSTVYTGGQFNALGASNFKNLAALGSDGSLDTGFKPDPDGRVESLAFDGTSLYIGGQFENIADGTLAALDPASGSARGDFSPDFEDSARPADPTVFAIEPTGPSLYVGGSFSHVDGEKRWSLAELGASGGSAPGALTPWDPSAGGEPGQPDWPAQVHDVEASCETVYVGGSFTRIGLSSGDTQPERNKIAALDPVSGDVTPWNPDASATVHDLAVLGDTVLAVGNFSVVGGQSRKSIAALVADELGDGTGRAVEGWNPSANQRVHAVAPSADGQEVFIGGQFTEAGGATRNGLAALAAPGVGDGSGGPMAWNPAPGDPFQIPHGDGRTFKTNALEVDGESVYVGGEFTAVGSRAQSGFAPFTSGGSGDDTQLDCGLPTVTITSGPEGSVPETSASFSFEASDPRAELECSLDGNPFEPCTSPKSYEGLALGQHTFAVRARRPGSELRGPEATATWTIQPLSQRTAQPTCKPEIVGTEGKDKLKGTKKGDEMRALGGRDKAIGRKGADCIDAGKGRDVVKAGKGSDEIFGGGGADELDGRQGSDEIFGGNRADLLIGGPGKDRLDGQKGPDLLKGGPKDDRLEGGLGDDKVKGGSGKDKLVSGDGDDKLIGGKGKDKLVGGEGKNVLKGGKGGDKIKSTSKKDRIKGGKGKDTIKTVDGKRDVVNCGKGRDKVVADKKDKLRSCERRKRKKPSS